MQVGFYAFIVQAIYSAYHVKSDLLFSSFWESSHFLSSQVSIEWIPVLGPSISQEVVALLSWVHCLSSCTYSSWSCIIKFLQLSICSSLRRRLHIAVNFSHKRLTINLKKLTSSSSGDYEICCCCYFRQQMALSIGIDHPYPLQHSRVIISTIRQKAAKESQA